MDKAFGFVRTVFSPHPLYGVYVCGGQAFRKCILCRSAGGFRLEACAVLCLGICVK